MTDWNTDELERIGRAEEVRLASRRSHDSLSGFTTMWVVCVGEHLYVRSAYGPDSAWYRRARAAGEGRIRAGDVERDVSFVHMPRDATETHRAVDDAYHAKYDQHGPRIVGTVVGPDAAAVTLRLEPRQ